METRATFSPRRSAQLARAAVRKLGSEYGVSIVQIVFLAIIISQSTKYYVFEQRRYTAGNLYSEKNIRIYLGLIHHFDFDRIPGLQPGAGDAEVVSYDEAKELADSLGIGRSLPRPQY